MDRRSARERIVARWSEIEGNVYLRSDFNDCGLRTAVNRALSRLGADPEPGALRTGSRSGDGLAIEAWATGRSASCLSVYWTVRSDDLLADAQAPSAIQRVQTQALGTEPSAPIAVAPVVDREQVQGIRLIPIDRNFHFSKGFSGVFSQLSETQIRHKRRWDRSLVAEQRVLSPPF